MTKRYETTSTSAKTAQVNDIVLSSTATTRKVLRATLIDNSADPDAATKIVLVHQRKSPADEWIDLPGDGFNKLKAGEAAKFPLDSADTLELYKQLKVLYSLFDGKQIPWGDKSLVVGYPHELVKVDANRAAFVQNLVDQGHGEEVWLELAKANGELATKLSHARIQAERAEALVEFETSLPKGLNERDFWDGFFQSHLWIFGYGLNYQFLSNLTGQASYGGADVTGKGNQRGDNLMSSEADVRFTVLVEIKAPDTKLLAESSHRNGAYAPSRELTEAVTQVQVNARQWEVEGSRTDANRENLSEAGIYTVAPRGVLVVGNTSQLNNGDKKRSFELYRRSLKTPEVLTFDELLGRARYIVGNASQNASASPSSEG